MLSALAIVPSAPVMVPELASGAAAETADLRAAALEAVRGLPARWIAIGVAEQDGVYGPDRAGTFGGYGVDIRVALSPEATTSAPTALPLCALICGWLRGQARPDARVETRAYRAEHAGPVALGFGARLREQIDADAADIGVVIVADGANTLTPAAPGGYDEDSPTVQSALDDALAAGDCAALTRLPSGVLGRVGYQVLAGLAGTGPRTAAELYRGAPYGVGYFAGVWTP